MLKSFNIILKGKFILIICLFFIGCIEKDKELSDSLLKPFQYTNDDIQKIEEIYFKDQFLRRATYVFDEIDKIKVIPNNQKRNYFNDLSNIKSAINICYRDKLDEQNIQDLLEIIKHKPYPAIRDSIVDVPVFKIFMHTPDDLNTSVRDYINDQYIKGNMEAFEMDKIMWHLNGRKMEDFKSAKFGIRYYTDQEVFEYFQNFSICN